MDIATEIAFINGARAMDPADFAFAVAACQIQLQRDFLPLWSAALAVKRELVIAGYTSSTDLGPGTFAPIEVVTSIGDPSTLGDHAGIEIAKQYWGRSQPDSVVMSHEALEMAGDPYVNRWVRLSSGLIVALEDVDPVESDTYLIEVTLAGQTRQVPVSNFVTPIWFGEGDWTGARFDFMNLCTAPGENRGYMIVENPDGTTENRFAATASDAYRAKVEAKKTATTRTAMRHAATDRTYCHRLW